MQMNKVRIGIIGFGKHGSHYVRRYLETDICKDVELTAIADNNAARLGWAKEHLENVAFFDDALKMLDSGLIDACQIAVPHPDHYRYIRECFKRGIHVLCEKPLCVYADDIKAVIKEHQEHYPELVFGVMLNQRQNPLYQKLKELLDNKTYGKVRRVDWTITNWYRNQVYFDESYWHATWVGEAGGLIMNQATHQLDLWQWLFGLPDRVYAKLGYGKGHDIEADDEATVFFEYDNGVCGIFNTSSNDIFGVNSLKIQTDQALLLVENQKIIVRMIDEEKTSNKEIYRLMYEKPAFRDLEIPIEGTDPKHEGVVNEFADAILNNRPLKTKAEEGLNSIILCNAIYLSSFLNKEISIPGDEKLYRDELAKRMKNSHLRLDAMDSISGILSSYDDNIKTGYNNAIKNR